MSVRGRMIWNSNVQQIVETDTYCDDDTLTCFNPIYASKNIDRIGAKDAQEGHVRIVQPSYTINPLVSNEVRYQGQLSAEDSEEDVWE